MIRSQLSGLFFFLGILGSAGGLMAQGPKDAAATPATAAHYEEIEILGEELKNGVFDPSLEYDGRGTLWMAYSRVEVPKKVDTHLAKSTDGGKTWHFVAGVNPTAEGSIHTSGGQTVVGVWRHETPTLVRDPTDRARPWKLIWHKYFASAPYDAPQSRMFQYGWMAFREAADPAGPWSEEKPLLGAGPFPPSPFTTAVNVAKLHPDLSDCKVLTEPGSLASGGRLYLSLQAYHRGLFSSHWSILLLSSADHGRSWQYVATLLEAAQAKPYGGDFFTGTSLAADHGRNFLLVCPEQEGKGMTPNRGTVVFEFEDLARGKLRSDERAAPLPVRRLLPQLASGGQSDYDEQNTYGGIVMPQFDPANLPRPWRIYNTQARIVEAKR